jgi:hypothetical protein
MNNEQKPTEEERELLELFSRSALNDYPNPERIGCPGEAFLRQLATNRKSIPITDPRLDHIVQCSPCFQEFSLFKERASKAPDKERTQPPLRILAYAAAVAALLVPTVWVIRHHGPFAPKFNEGASARTMMMNFAVTSADRGGSDNSSNPAVIQEYPREPLVLSIGLPRGSESGSYQFELRQPTEGVVVFRGSGTATILKGLTTFSLRLDLSKIPAGSYDARVRHLPLGVWQDLTVQIR